MLRFLTTEHMFQDQASIWGSGNLPKWQAEPQGGLAKPDTESSGRGFICISFCLGVLMLSLPRTGNHPGVSESQDAGGPTQVVLRIDLQGVKGKLILMLVTVVRPPYWGGGG